MSFQSDQLDAEYKTKIVSGRRYNDAVWDFFHFDSPKRAAWISELMRFIEGQLGDMLTEWDLARMQVLETMEAHNSQYALWLGCLTLYTDIMQFLLTSPTVQKVNVSLLAQFLDQHVFALVQEWREGRFRDVHSWVRHVRAAYAMTVPCLHYLPPASPTEKLLLQ